jgi:hypothetical protein
MSFISHTEEGIPMRIRGITVGIAVMGATLSLRAVPVLAHDCFNPTKNEHAPTAGVNYTITSLEGPNGPVFEQTGPGKGYGGFIALSPQATGAPETLYTHSLGNTSKENGHKVVGGPGSQKPNHACDGKGIDYLEACGTGG